MVLTEEEVALASKSEDRNVIENFDRRQCSETLLAQTLCDREIQRSLGHKETDAFKINCYIIHHPSWFLEVFIFLLE
jgi:hypothetical protein